MLGRIAHNAAVGSTVNSDNGPIALLFSAAFVEALMNEYLHDLARRKDADDEPLEALARAAGLHDRFTPLDRKFKVLKLGASSDPLDFGSGAFQRMALLLELRNWLVHLRPEQLNLVENLEDPGDLLVNVDHHKLVSQLVNCGALKELPEKRMFPLATAVCMPEVAVWCYNTAYAVVVETAKWLPQWRAPHDMHPAI